MGVLEKNQNGMPYEQYIKLFEKWEKADCEEKRFQDEVIQAFLRQLLPDLDVIETGQSRPYSKNHDLSQYCGQYRNEQGKKKFWRPDITICDEWYRFNVPTADGTDYHNVNYRCVVECKSPCLHERIYDKDDCLKELPDVKKELESHLSAANNKKVILTDAVKWIFFKDTIDKPCYIFNLKIKRDGGWHWQELEQTQYENLKTAIRRFIY